ncbi:hypothetical protein D7Z26_13585 [Cohnella endophytica]|uniref:Fibronectin type-III domain-containing protein n=1 Tax=Cohnella endophytica TaxID=2419778 RepID=A0A494Y213_9BACL|nr:hypothetical protein [Cohnella endophytica]RKP54382.1 hypothetical protein D7Z26_13585 [Cohnella endophytica]
MRTRISKFLHCFSLILAIIPVFTAHAATNANATNVTTDSLTLNWTLQSGESFVQIYKDGVYLDSRAGLNSYNVTGLSPCTTYSFNVVGTSGYGSSSTSVTTLGCPTAPVISYTTTYSSISLSWTSSNAVSYDIYKDGSFVANTSSTSYTLGASPSRSYEVKVVAKNATGQTAQSSVWASTPGYSASWTAYNLSGNIRVGGAFTNTNTTYSTSMYITLYRVTGSGDVYVGSTSVYIPAGQTVGGWYPVATGQPLGDYKAVLTSPYAITSGISIGTY